MTELDKRKVKPHIYISNDYEFGRGIPPTLAEAVPAESEGISALNVLPRIFFMRGGIEEAVSSLTEIAHLKSEQPKAKINNHICLHREDFSSTLDPMAILQRNDSSVY